MRISSKDLTNYKMQTRIMGALRSILDDFDDGECRPLGYMASSILKKSLSVPSTIRIGTAQWPIADLDDPEVIRIMRLDEPAPERTFAHAWLETDDYEIIDLAPSVMHLNPKEGQNPTPMPAYFLAANEKDSLASGYRRTPYDPSLGLFIRSHSAIIRYLTEGELPSIDPNDEPPVMPMISQNIMEATASFQALLESPSCPTIPVINNWWTIKKMAKKSDPWAQSVMRMRMHVPFMVSHTVEEMEEIVQSPDGEYQEIDISDQKTLH